MGAQRAFFPATVLNSGQVLAAGGRNRLQYGLATAVLYNPSMGSFSATGHLNTGRANFTATPSNNGQVLVAGGDAYVWMVSGTQHYCFASAELYNPLTGTFTPTGSMHAQRCSYLAPGFTATLLPNGKVLIAGGGNTNGLVPAAEVYDPTSGTFSLTGNLNTPRIGHTATLLPTAEVLIAGGADSAGNYLANAELYNPSTGTFTPTGSMSTTREFFTATLPNNGQVLVAGGQNSNLAFPYISSAELYNPASGTFSVAANLNTGCTDHATVLLTNGEALTMGGYAGSGGNIGYLSSAELFH